MNELSSSASALLNSRMLAPANAQWSSNSPDKQRTSERVIDCCMRAAAVNGVGTGGKLYAVGIRLFGEARMELCDVEIERLARHLSLDDAHVCRTLISNKQIADPDFSAIFNQVAQAEWVKPQRGQSFRGPGMSHLMVGYASAIALVLAETTSHAMLPELTHPSSVTAAADWTPLLGATRISVGRVGSFSKCIRYGQLQGAEQFVAASLDAPISGWGALA